MDVLIVERDELVAEFLATALADDGLSAGILYTEQDVEAVDDPPRVVVTSINRKGEDLKGLAAGRDLCRRWRCVGVVYLAALWPAKLRALSPRERFLEKPLSLPRMTAAVRELLGYENQLQTGLGARCRIITSTWARQSQRQASGFRLGLIGSYA